LPGARGLASRGDYRELSKAERDGTAVFAHWLIDHGHLQRQCVITDGCLVFYFRDGVWQHAGTGHDDGTVVSKWGEFPLLRHPIEQVPSFYGNTVVAYEHPGADAAMALFHAFIADCDRVLEGYDWLDVFSDRFLAMEARLHLERAKK
jgi:hypothetical protein